MQARVEISSALLNDLALLTVDAPAFGLDPSERVRVRHLLSELAGERVMRLATRVGYRAQAVSGLFLFRYRSVAAIQANSRPCLLSVFSMRNSVLFALALACALFVTTPESASAQALREQGEEEQIEARIDWFYGPRLQAASAKQAASLRALEARYKRNVPQIRRAAGA